MNKKSVFGLSENVVSGLCYVGLFFTGIVFLVMERDNKTVRFHALQSTLWFLLLAITSWVVGFIIRIPIIGWLLSPVGMVISLLTGISWLFLMYMAFTGKKFKLPLIGDVVEAQVK